jgi:ribosome-binding protein aMBF1 (putative translation factor)
MGGKGMTIVNFGTFIKEMRRRKEMTQEQYAQSMKYHTVSQGRMEAGKHIPRNQSHLQDQPPEVLLMRY